MANEYLYGAYGHIGETVAQSAVQAGTTPVYIGTAPVNLVRGFGEAGIINAPIKITSLVDAQKKIGYSSDWGLTKEEDIMKKIGIMTDSHSGILSEEAQRLGIKVLPMPFYIGEKVYREGVDLSRDEFYDIDVYKRQVKILINSWKRA